MSAQYAKTLSTIWTTVGVLSFYITLNTWARTQNSELDLPFDLFKSFGPRAALLFAIPLCCILYITMCFVGEEHAQATKGKSWRSRLPKAFAADLEVDITSAVGRWYQRLFLFAFVAFPAGGMIHFVRRFINTPIYEKGTQTKHSVFYPDWSSPFDALAYTFDCRTFFPAWQAWVYLLLVAFAGYRLYRFVRSLRAQL